jgi:hypothetical protein
MLRNGDFPTFGDTFQFRSSKGINLAVIRVPLYRYGNKRDVGVEA